MTVIRNPHQARIEARGLKYDNYTDEVLNLERVDGEVYQRVSVFERAMVDHALAHGDRGDQLASQAINMEADMLTRFRAAAENGEVSRDMLRDFGRLRAQAERLADSLDTAERAASWHSSRLDDVYGAWLKILDKYPSLKPGIQI